jgi:hypothetical protein
MYNKLFTKILDSSIWLETDHTRLIWITLLATMDEDGFCQYASVANLAHRSIVPVEAAQKAVNALESPDENSSDPDNEGRRIERVPGGWIVLNSKKYREMATRQIIREKTRLRVAEFRKRRRNDVVQSCNADVTQANDPVRQADTETKAKTNTLARKCELLYEAYPRRAQPVKAKKAIEKVLKDGVDFDVLLAQVKRFAQSDKAKGDYCPHPATWFNAGSYNEDSTEWNRRQGNGETNGTYRGSPAKQRVDAARSRLAQAAIDRGLIGIDCDDGIPGTALPFAGFGK